MIFKKNKKDKVNEFKEKCDMYDMMVAEWVARNSIVEPLVELDASKISIGYSALASETQMSKFFMIRNFPDYIQPHLMDAIRSKCLAPGIKINFYIYGTPHEINWDSPEMKNRMQIWKSYAEDTPENTNVFEYRAKRDASLTRERLIKSTKYLNESELDFRRTLFKVSFVVEIICKRNDKSMINMRDSIIAFKKLCSNSDIKYKEIRVNMLDWLSTLGIFSLRQIREVNSKMAKKIMTDDILAIMNSYKQGRVGEKGIPLGIDVVSKSVVMKMFKANPDAPENWLIAAGTGGGKSMFAKQLIPYFLALGFVVTVMDYEGDEYNNFANYVKASNPEDVKIVSMGKSSAVYVDPLEIPNLTYDDEIDNDLKKTAQSYALAIFKIIVAGLDRDLSKLEERVISSAIKRVYEEAGVTDDKYTWKRSKGLRISQVYDQISYMVESKEFIDEATENIKHKVAVSVLDAATVYFEEGEVKSDTFKNPLSINDLFKCKLIIFSFGMRGSDLSAEDRVTLALKQLSVSNISTQISNHSKYVLNTFNVKYWEEYQRWGEAQGSGEIISNAMTGGRKRGDINFILTNDLNAILDDKNGINTKIRNNIQNYAIGKTPDKDTRDKFCEKFDLKDIAPALEKIAMANSDDGDGRNDGNRSGYSNRYKFSFCLVLDTGKKAVVKAMLPNSLRTSDLYKTGVDIDKQKKI